MKQEELRIGNYVKNLYSGNEVELNPLMLYEFDDYLQPIPLTEEWLLKFGFENPSEQYFSKGKCAVFQHKNGDFELTLGRGLSAPFKYVHQLQNLYFALTGKELTIQK